VPHDPPDGGQVGAGHGPPGGCRVAEEVKPNVPDLADWRQLEVALRAPRVRVRRRLMTAPFPAALVDVAGDQARAASARAAALPEDFAVRRREDESDRDSLVAKAPTRMIPSRRRLGSSARRLGSSARPRSTEQGYSARPPSTALDIAQKWRRRESNLPGDDRQPKRRTDLHGHCGDLAFSRWGGTGRLGTGEIR